MYLVPPMDDEAPPDYVAFVAAHLDDLCRETDRLVGGDTEARHLYVDVLADVAGHWRRLYLKGRLLGRDAATDYLWNRLHSRTKEWREDQIYEVDVRVLRRPAPVFAAATTHGDRSSVALRKASLLPGTARTDLLPCADAGIAWVHAYRRQQWHRVGRLIATGILLVGGMIQYMSWLSAGY